MAYTTITAGNSVAISVPAGYWLTVGGGYGTVQAVSPPASSAASQLRTIAGSNVTVGPFTTATTVNIVATTDLQYVVDNGTSPTFTAAEVTQLRIAASTIPDNNTIAIVGNSITLQGAAVQQQTAAVGWLANAAITTTSVAFPKYQNIQNGVSFISWVCTKAGTTGPLEPDWPMNAAAGATVTDGTVVWTATALGGVGLPPAWSHGWWHWAQALSGARLRESIIVGRSGATSDEILLYMPRVRAASNIATIFYANMFENDCWPGAAPTLATISARWAAVAADIDASRAAGKKVIVQTCLPNGSIDGSAAFTSYSAGTGTKAWLWLNNKIREFCRQRADVIFFDAAMVYLDGNPANPVWPRNSVTYLSSAGTGQQLKDTDGVHPYLVAGYLIGKALAPILAANYLPRPIFTTAGDLTQNTSNPLNFGTAGTRDATIGSGTVPNNLTLACYGGTAGSQVASAVARTDDIAGNWARATYLSASGGDSAQCFWTSGQAPAYSPGEVVQAIAEIRVLANPTLHTVPYVKLRHVGATEQWAQSLNVVGTNQDLGQALTADTTFTLRTPPMVAPSGTATCLVYGVVAFRGAASGTADFGRACILRYTQASTP